MSDPAGEHLSKRAAPPETNPSRKAARAVASVGQLENVATVAEALQQDMRAVYKTLKGPENKAVGCGRAPAPMHGTSCMSAEDSYIRNSNSRILKKKSHHARSRDAGVL